VGLRQECCLLSQEAEDLVYFVSKSIIGPLLRCLIDSIHLVEDTREVMLDGAESNTELSSNVTVAY
jgi:hypothetical protein